MNEELKRQTYDLMLEHPTWSDQEIADKLNVSRSAVWRVRNKIVVGIDYELTKKIAGKFLVDFQMASDYFTKQIERLEQLKTQEQIVYHTNAKTGGSFAIKEPLNPMDILQIEKQQTELWKARLFLCRQNEAIQIMKLIQNGQLQLSKPDN